MSTTLKAPDVSKNSKYEKGQLSNRPPIPYVAEMDILTTREEPQVMKVKLTNNSHLNIPIYSHGNTKEYIMHIVAVLCIIKQKGLDAKCRKLGKAVVRQSQMSKNLSKLLGPRTPSCWILTFRPTRWRLIRLNRCSKKPRRLTTRQLPRPRHMGS
jgi:hypothetical protein